jgi:hypothetical protein
LKSQNHNQKGELMTILPISLKNSKSAVEFFKQGGKVEIPRPEQCLFPGCGLKQPLRKNGSYARQVIYWGICFLVQIARFRCRRCGKTASRPYGWLVPYRRFSAEVIVAGVEAYARQDVTYWDLSIELSEIELADPEMDIREEEAFKRLLEGGAVRQRNEAGEPPCRPVRSTIFYWVDFVCKHIEGMLTQLQKELVQEMKRGRQAAALPAESLVENPNSYKAASEEKGSMLNRLSFATCAADWMLGRGKRQWYRLRAYFLAAAESRDDILTDTRLQLPITQSFELDIC